MSSDEQHLTNQTNGERAQPYEPHSKETIADKLAPKGKPKAKHTVSPTLRDLARAFAERELMTDPPSPDNLTADSHTKDDPMIDNDHQGMIMTRDDVVSAKVYGVIALDDPAEDPRQPLIDKLWGLLGQIDLAENFSLRIGVDEKVPAPYGAVFIQVRCWRRDVITGKWGFGWGGKATVSPFQTESEIVGMAFGLYKSYFEHEARETFKFEDRRIFGPHIDVRALHSIARKVDVRSAQHTTDKL